MSISTVEASTSSPDVAALEAAYQSAAQKLQDLEAENDRIYEAMAAAANVGDGDAYVSAKRRLHDLPDRLKVARLNHARTGYEHARAAHAVLEAQDLAAAADHGPYHASQTGGMVYDARSVETNVMLSRLNGFRTAMARAEKELAR